MKKLILLSSFCLFASHSATALEELPPGLPKLSFEVRNTSGFTRPEDSFDYHCTINTQGGLSVAHFKTRQVGENWESYLYAHREEELSKKTFAELKEKLQMAATGNIHEDVALCDAGTVSYVGYIDSQEIPLRKHLDCAARIDNDASIVPELIAELKELCQAPR